jgi:hypothetical protein
VAADISQLVNDPNAKFSKSFNFNKPIEKKITAITSKFQEENLKLTEAEIAKSWELSNLKNDEIVKDYIKTISGLKTAERAALFIPNTSALEAFIARDRGAGKLADVIWKVSGQLRAEMEIHLGLGILNGDSANTISRRIRQYLSDPEALFRRVRDKNGKLVASQAMIDNAPGQGRYNSAYRNALRVARTETNMAYLAADHERWKTLDFVKGIKISLSEQHPNYKYPEICEQLEGDYPAEFKFIGWHSQCYDKQTEVLTVEGWKYFKDVEIGDEIISLNKETRDLEISKTIDKVEYQKDGKMVHFSNIGLDLLVTLEHKMIYLGKGKGIYFNEKLAIDYKKTHGAIYRSSEWVGKEIESIQIGKYSVDFDTYCEFMGYYLSDGSVSFTKKTEFNISQSPKFDNAKEDIEACLKKMPFEYWKGQLGFGINNKEFRDHLADFGKSLVKYIPDIIKQSSARQIGIFITAFSKCDGTIRKPHSFVGSRGNKFEPKNDEITLFSSSKKMADDLGELILKIGKRPSYKIMPAKKQQFRNGVYDVQECWRISICNGKTSSVFKKEIVDYSGMVYDIEIEKNHTLYVRRNGKCAWSSNCLCHATPILQPQADFEKSLAGEDVKVEPIKETPENFNRYMNENYDRYIGYKSQPYFMIDNKKIINKPIK